jgi:hypothetical protein
MNFAESHIAKIIIIIIIIITIIKYCRKPNTERYKPATVCYRKHVLFASSIPTQNQSPNVTYLVAMRFRVYGTSNHDLLFT